jgi:NAD-dependent DNA ligase
MQLRLLPGLADKKILQILQAIETTKMLPFWRWLHAFGIDGVGIKTAQELEQWLAQQ